MKKYVVLITLVLVFVGGLASLLFLLLNTKDPNTSKVEPFCLTEYQWEIQTFSADQNVGEVNDKNIAIKTAQWLWSEKYSVDISEKKIEVFYDAKEECWHVYGSQSPDMLGGALHAIVRKNGDLIAVWIDD